MFYYVFYAWIQEDVPFFPSLRRLLPATTLWTDPMMKAQRYDHTVKRFFVEEKLVERAEETNGKYPLEN